MASQSESVKAFISSVQKVSAFNGANTSALLNENGSVFKEISRAFEHFIGESGGDESGGGEVESSRFNSLGNYALLSDYDVTFSDDNFVSKIYLYNSITRSVDLTWSLGADFGGFDKRAAIVHWRNNGATNDVFLSVQNSSTATFDVRLVKLTNCVFDIEGQEITYDSIDFVDLPNSYFYQSYDENNIWYLNNNPANIVRVSIAGKLESETFDLSPNFNFVSSGDTTPVKSDENCIYFVRYGQSPTFETEFVMCRKSDPTTEVVLFNMSDEAAGYVTAFDIDYANREIVFALTAIAGNGTQFSQQSFILRKYNFDTFDFLGRAEIPMMTNPDDGEAYLSRISAMHFNRRRLYCVGTRNPQVFVVDPYTLTLESSHDLRGDLSSGLITNTDYQRSSGVKETGWVRHLPYEISNNEMVLSVQSDDHRIGIFSLNTHTVETVITDVNHPINYVTYLVRPPQFSPRLPALSAAEKSLLTRNAGIEFTGGFAGKPLSNNYVWEAGIGIEITSADVAAGIYKTFSMDSTVQAQVDTPYWTDPAPADHNGKGVFGGSYLPSGVTNVFDYTTVDSDTYEDGSNVATTGGLDFSQLQVGDKVEIRFDFNAIPKIANTTLQPAIWYKNRDENGDVTFTFPLTAQPIFYGTGTVGKTYLNRIEMSIYIASQEDIDSLSHFAIRSDNVITIQPLSTLFTLVR